MPASHLTSRTPSCKSGLGLLLPVLVLLGSLCIDSRAADDPAFSPGQILVKLRDAVSKPTVGSLGHLAQRFGFFRPPRQ